MAPNNNDARKKQKKTVAFDDDGDGDGDDSLSLPTPVVVVPALSVGNVLKEFPDFLFCLLPYVADRVIWNSIASSNKDMHEKSKAIQPPWPLCYKLPSDDSCSVMTWSPCGTRIACSVYKRNIIVIVDQRLGPLHNRRIAHGGQVIKNLKYSPNGRFLVSAGYDGFVKLWDNTRNYEQLQEWNMAEEVAEESLDVVDVCVSSCSKYILVSLGIYVFLKVVDGGKRIKSLMAPFISRNEEIYNTKFSSDGRAIFMCCREQNNGVVIKVWHPYLDDDDEDRLIILWREAVTTGMRGFQTVTFSNDNTMVAIHDWSRDKGTVWSIDTDHKKCLTEKFNFPKCLGFYFTPDDKYIIYNTRIGPEVRSIVGNNITNTTINFLMNRNITEHDLLVKSVSPNKRQLIVQQLTTHDFCIASFCIL